MGTKLINRFSKIIRFFIFFVISIMINFEFSGNVYAGSLSDSNISISSIKNSSLSFGDYDNDGDLDLAICGISGSTRISKIYTNTGSNFVESSINLIGVHNGDIDWGDYDKDGDLDIVLTGDVGDNFGISKIYVNDNVIYKEVSPKILDKLQKYLNNYFFGKVTVKYIPSLRRFANGELQLRTVVCIHSNSYKDDKKDAQQKLEEAEKLTERFFLLEESKEYTRKELGLKKKKDNL